MVFVVIQFVGVLKTARILEYLGRKGCWIYGGTRDYRGHKFAEEHMIQVV